MNNLTEEQVYKTIGKKIRDVRIRLGITQADLAKSIDIVRTSLINIEAGEQKIPVFTLYKIAKKLQIPITDLLPEFEERIVNINHLIDMQKVISGLGIEDNLEENEKKQILELIINQRRKTNDWEDEKDSKTS